MDYDPGILNDFGGGNIGWWQDYLRPEIERCNEHWREQTSKAELSIRAEESTNGAKCTNCGGLKGVYSCSCDSARPETPRP